MFPTYPLYTFNLPRYWLVRDVPSGRTYLPISDKRCPLVSHGSMMFHVSAGDYLTTLVSILRFFEESLKDDKITPEMRALELKTIREVMSDLIYLNKSYTLVPKNEKSDQKT